MNIVDKANERSIAMARQGRIVAVGSPDHVTQRGNRRWAMVFAGAGA